MMGSDIFLQRAIVASEVNSTAAFAFFHWKACDDRRHPQCPATGAQRCPNSKGILQKTTKGPVLSAELSDSQWCGSSGIHFVA